MKWILDRLLPIGNCPKVNTLVYCIHINRPANGFLFDCRPDVADNGVSGVQAILACSRACQRRA